MSQDARQTIDDLQAEYRELNERKLSNLLEDGDHERMMEAWHELRRRTGVEQPECPECGFRSWGFDDHTVCLECGHGPIDEELLGDIQAAWSDIIHGSHDD